ncbi:MAG: hypothetical protein GY711_01075 [bacterium]|nr:hypothetical protein [bacterium]
MTCSFSVFAIVLGATLWPRFFSAPCQRSANRHSEIGCLRSDESVFQDVIGWRGRRTPITAGVADLSLTPAPLSEDPRERRRCVHALDFLDPKDPASMITANEVRNFQYWCRMGTSELGWDCNYSDAISVCFMD